MSNPIRNVFIVGGIAVLAVVWALFRPELLFIDQSVSEAFPAGGPGSASAMPGSTAMSVNERMAAQSMVVRSGAFHGVAHETKGTASVHQLADGKRVLRFTGFETSNGPDLRVLLIAANDASDNDTVKGSMPRELAPLKGNIGDQNYELPADVDLDVYRAVTIWCNRFSVNFATAPLGMLPPPMSNEGGNTMNEQMPMQPTVLSTGSFHGVAHDTRGTATVYRVADGKRVLRLADFATSNGPDVRVLLIAAADASDNDSVKGSAPIELGRLKGNVGDQNYDVPAAVDLDTYRAVTIWCNRFSVNFGTAPLR